MGFNTECHVKKLPQELFFLFIYLLSCLFVPPAEQVFLQSIIVNWNYKDKIVLSIAQKSLDIREQLISHVTGATVNVINYDYQFFKTNHRGFSNLNIILDDISCLFEPILSLQAFAHHILETGFELFGSEQGWLVVGYLQFVETTIEKCQQESTQS